MLVSFFEGRVACLRWAWHLLRSGKSACKEIHARRLPNSIFWGSVVMSAMFTFCTRWTVYHWRMSILDKRYQDIPQHCKTGNGMVSWRSQMLKSNVESAGCREEGRWTSKTLCRDVCSHVFSRTVLNINNVSFNSFSNVVKFNVNVLRSRIKLRIFT